MHDPMVNINCMNQYKSIGRDILPFRLDLQAFLLRQTESTNR